MSTIDTTATGRTYYHHATGERFIALEGSTVAGCIELRALSDGASAWVTPAELAADFRPALRAAG